MACEPLLWRKAGAVEERLPLTSTSVMSGVRPSSEAGRMNCGPSDEGRCSTLKLGTSVASVSSTLLVTVERIDFWEKTSTGESASNWVCACWRVPVTMIVSARAPSSGAALASCAWAVPCRCEGDTEATPDRATVQ